MSAFFSRIKGYLLGAVGIAAAITIGLLYIGLHIARGQAKKGRRQAANLRAKLALATANAKRTASVQAAARKAAETVADEATQQNAPDTEARDDFEGTQ
jgi:hypothetical protein